MQGGGLLVEVLRYIGRVLLWISIPSGMSKLLRAAWYQRLLYPTGLGVLLLSLLFPLGCANDVEYDVTPLSEVALIPIPQSVSNTSGNLDVSHFEAFDLGDSASDLAAYLQEAMAWMPGADENTSTSGASLQFIEDATVPDEGYVLSVLPEGLSIAASSTAGHFYGLQTLRQLLEQAARENGRLALGTVTDGPRFEYRGVMLDIARHFHSPAEIKRVIDLISQYKMNALHLHLSDDQGWRIQINSWPKLTEVGGSTQVGGKRGGFLTQADYTDIVAYAAQRYVTIVPEIDMPGHTQSALASYPELNCNPKDPDPQLYEGTEVGFSTFCIGKPVVMEFVRDVLTELAAITPGPYLHMGGDESHSTDSTDYRNFVAEVEPIVRGLGKRMIGWDEVVTAEIDPSAVVQLWRSEENAKAAVERGHKVLMSPAQFAYLDMQYDSTSRIGLHWAAYIEVDEGYTWDPGTVLSQISDESILGVEAPLWSETVEERSDIDYLMFPRALGYAEIGWSAPELRDWSTYRNRLGAHAGRLDKQGVDFYRSARVDWIDNTDDPSSQP